MPKGIALAALLAAIAAVTFPSGAAARTHRTPAELIAQAVGPGTLVWGCRAHGRGILCEYRTPEANAGFESEGPPTYWYSAAVVEHGRVRFP